jgi:hypothetical protein
MDRRILAALLLVLAATRLPRLTALPIFMDESVHVCWAARFAREPSFLKPLEDGKLLHVVMTALTVPWAAEPLWAARAVSVVVGALGLAALWAAACRLYDNATALVAGVLYLACPFTFFYDRMDLADVYLSSAASAVLLSTLRLLESGRRKDAVLTGLALAACILSKMPGLVVLSVPLAAALLLKKDGASPPWRHLALAYVVCVVVAAAPAVYFFRHTTQFEAKAAHDFDPVGLARENLALAFEWLWGYWTPPLCVAGAAGALLGLRRDGGRERLLALAVLVPIVPYVVLAYDWFPRYILLASPPFLLLAARAITLGAARLKAPRLALAPVLAAALVPALRFDAMLLWDPAQAPIPGLDGFQYVWGWPSGYGWDEALRLLDRERAAHPEGLMVLGDQSGRGAGRWALRAHFVNDPKVQVEMMDVTDPGVLRMLDESARARPTFVVLSKTLPVPEGAQLTATLRKPNGDVAGWLYRLPAKG